MVVVMMVVCLVGSDIDSSDSVVVITTMVR